MDDLLGFCRGIFVNRLFAPPWLIGLLSLLTIVALASPSRPNVMFILSAWMYTVDRGATIVPAEST